MTAGPDLSVAALVQEASARSGLRAGGHVPFVSTLELLVASCQRTGALNETGRQVLRKASVRHLRNLAYLDAHAGADPDVKGRSLGAPIVVTGLPRTGTTLLHNLLALDPRHRVLRFWEALHPVPPGSGGPSEEDLRAQARRWLDAFYGAVPEFQAIHRATPDGPEECDALLQNTFASQHFDDMFDAEDYSAWLAGAALTSEYEHYALQLRVLSPPPGPEGGGAPPARTWALKSPGHLGHLDALTAVLPGCAVVLCHRHPREAVASHASLIHALRRTYSDEVSAAVVGRQALERGATAMRRALEVRAGGPGAPGGAVFVDVSYARLVEDPVGAVRAVYGRLGRALEAGTEEAMHQWVLANPAGRHGPHRYDLDRFGLTPDAVDEAFGPYLERFGALVVAGD